MVDYRHMTNMKWILLKDVLIEFIDKLFYENFNITFIEKIKKKKKNFK